MNRIILAAVAGSLLVPALSGCGETEVEGCPIISASPNSNIYYLDYELVIPAKCPIPLASPGTEKKYAAAEIWDFNGSDMTWATVEVHNSAGRRVATETVPFLVTTSAGYAEPRAEYVAATGGKTFNDHDIATFRAFNLTTGAAANGKTKLTYQRSSLSTRLAGEPVPLPNTTHTWSAPVSGGYPGFMYNWYRDGSHVGNGSSYSAAVGTTDFNLRVEVTDQTWSTVAAVLVVDVGGVEPSITGPSTVYEGDGSEWTASARGGTGVYTFNWYVDDVWVESGPVFDGSVGAGSHVLRVDAQDTAGEYGTESKPVRMEALQCTDGARLC
jgi:hypothetical protein